MAQTAHCINNILTLAFVARQMKVRHQAMQIESRLNELLKHRDAGYLPAIVLPVPDEADPNQPRVVFKSSHGYSTIILTQLTIGLQIEYSPDWQTDEARRLRYILDRIPLLFSLSELMDKAEVAYTGITTLIQIPWGKNDAEVLRYLADNTLKTGYEENLFDVGIRKASIIDGKYYENLTLSNYREYAFDSRLMNITPALAGVGSPVSQGIQIESDFNDRYAFNTNSKLYRSTIEAVRSVVELAFITNAKTVDLCTKGVLNNAS